MKRLLETKVKKVNSEHNTIINSQDLIIGEGYFTVIAGPCAVENENVAVETAKAVEKAGAKVFRSSLFKPRTSPYTYQGYGLDGIEILRTIKQETNL